VDKIMPNIDHIVVLMLENRSFDNLVGWLYDKKTKPQNWVSNDPKPQYQGLAFAKHCNVDAAGNSYCVNDKGADNTSVPTPDPNEKFAHMTQQQYWGQPNPVNCTKAPMDGFVRDYATAKDDPVAGDIMQTYIPTQVPFMSALAKGNAISDQWFAACPTQTLPNRAFMGAGTSEGRVNNMTFPFVFGATTIFNVLSDHDVSWKIYNQPKHLPSLTRAMFTKLWLQHESHFGDIDDFVDDCNSDNLPAYTFLEPTFITDPFTPLNQVTSEHPPSNVAAGDVFLQTVWKAISGPNSKVKDNTLFILTYDEHGGNYDHIPPPWGCVAPDSKSDPGHEGFGFNRWGVRIPTILASPYIPTGTVFRSTELTQYDHTSILATVLKWCGIENNDSVLGKRVAAAPTFEKIVSLSKPRLEEVALDTEIEVPPAKDRSADQLTDLENGVLRTFFSYSVNGKMSEQDFEESFKNVHTLADASNFLSKMRSELKLKPQS
jgi:phospholipase C